MAATRLCVESQAGASGVLRPATESAEPDEPAGTGAGPAAAHGAADPRSQSHLALDFMTETLYDGRHVRLLTIIDEGIGRAWETAMGVSLPVLDGVQTAGSFGDMLETEESRS